MRLILVRHGQTTSNVAGLLDTDEPGAGLTSLGLEQAAALPGVLREESIEVLYASTLLRTQQTAAPLASALGLEVRIRDGVREVRAGSLEMLGDEQSVQTYLTTSFAWSSGDLHARMPGAESGAEVFARYDAVVAEIAGSGAGTAAIVSHGSVIRSWTAARAENVTPAFAARNPLANTGAVVLEGSPGAGWRAVTWAGQAVHQAEGSIRH